MAPAMKQVLTVLPDDAGVALATVLARRLGLRESAAERAIRGGHVYLDNARSRDCARPVVLGQRIIVYPAPSGPSGQPSLAFAYEDHELVVVNKPPGLPSIAPRRGGPSVDGLLGERFGREVRLVHRLDADTSGLLLAARTAKAARLLSAALAAGGISRHYFVLVAALPTAHRFTVDAPLGRSRGLARVDHQTGKAARTDFEVLQAGPGGALLEARLSTGRMHQIRVHLASLGLPVLGDGSYGGAPAERLGLHAHRLCLSHPSYQRELELHAPLPESLRRLLAGFGC